MSRRQVGKVCSVEKRIGREQGGSLDGVLKLANVAWPIIAAKQVHRFFRKTVCRRRIFLMGFGQEIVCQVWDVFATIAQRGELKWNHIQAVVEVFTKLFPLHFALKVLIGRCNNAGVDLNRCVASGAGHFFFLQDS